MTNQAIDAAKIVRRYYSLASAAKYVGCDEGHLLHLGVMGRLRFFCFSGGDICVSYYSNKDYKSIIVAGCYFVGVDKAGLSNIELFGRCQASISTLVFSSTDIYQESLESIIKKIAAFSQDIYYSNCDGSEISIGNLFITGEEIERFLSGEEPLSAPDIPEEVKNHLIKEPATKGRNSYLKTIEALCKALTKSDLRQPKAAEAVMSALASAGVEPPLSDRTLRTYLNDAKAIAD